MESNGAANGDAGEENGKSGEPLVLVRENEEAESGKEASKSRRRGPLGKKRKAKSEDDDDEGEAEAAPTNIDANTGSDGEAVHSHE